jgi:hypothetical protein
LFSISMINDWSVHQFNIAIACTDGMRYGTFIECFLKVLFFSGMHC